MMGVELLEVVEDIWPGGHKIFVPQESDAKASKKTLIKIRIQSCREKNVDRHCKSGQKLVKTELNCWSYLIVIIRHLCITRDLGFVWEIEGEKSWILVDPHFCKFFIGESVCVKKGGESEYNVITCKFVTKAKMP